MLENFLKKCNDNHWIIIGVMAVSVFLIWSCGCVSKVPSLIDKEKFVDRQELKAELEYLVGLASARASDLDRQDQAKQALLDSAAFLDTTGQINPLGIINILTSFSAVAFGLDRNYKLKKKAAETAEKVNDIDKENSTA